MGKRNNSTEDSSSGKSSVLGALLELPFARDSGLCTRFATQITMRRTSSKSITVSIFQKPQHQQRELLSFVLSRKGGSRLSMAKNSSISSRR